MSAEQPTGGLSVEPITDEQAQQRGIPSWPIRTKEPSEFDWTYEEEETCYFVEGEVVIKTGRGQVRVGKGDLVTFQKGLSCVWTVREAVTKHCRPG